MKIPITNMNAEMLATKPDRKKIIMPLKNPPASPSISPLFIALLILTRRMIWLIIAIVAATIAIIRKTKQFSDRNSITILLFLLLQKLEKFDTAPRQQRKSEDHEYRLGTFRFSEALQSCAGQ